MDKCSPGQLKLSPPAGGRSDPISETRVHSPKATKSASCPHCLMGIALEPRRAKDRIDVRA
jgi:hypothetical protein